LGLDFFEDGSGFFDSSFGAFEGGGVVVAEGSGFGAAFGVAEVAVVDGLLAGGGFVVVSGYLLGFVCFGVFVVCGLGSSSGVGAGAAGWWVDGVSVCRAAAIEGFILGGGGRVGVARVWTTTPLLS